MRPLSSTAAACRDRVLDEAIGAPGGAGIEHHLRDRVRALALFLGQRNNRRMVLAQIVAHAGADAPSLGQLVGQVQFDRPGLEPLVLDPLIALGRQAQAARHRHPERAAVLLGVLDRRLSRRRITGVEVLLVEGEATVVALEEVAEPDAQVGAVGPRLRVGERQVVRALEPESAIIGLQRAWRRDPSLRPACTLNQELALIRKVRSAAPRLLSASPPCWSWRSGRAARGR